MRRSEVITIMSISAGLAVVAVGIYLKIEDIKNHYHYKRLESMHRNYGVDFDK